MGTPVAGEYAPDFTAKDQHGDTVRLADLAGQRVVLYFYPKDNTSVRWRRSACATGARSWSAAASGSWA